MEIIVHLDMESFLPKKACEIFCYYYLRMYGVISFEAGIIDIILKYVRDIEHDRFDELKKIYLAEHNTGSLRISTWEKIIIYEKLSEGFIRRFDKELNRISWQLISRYQKNISEEFIREFVNKICWFNVCDRRKFSESFIREFAHKIDWPRILYYNILTEEFMGEFAHKLSWPHVCKYQKLSESFIRKFADEMTRECWSYILKYQTLSKEFIDEFKYALYGS